MENNLLNQSTQEFINLLKEKSIRRFYFIYDAETKQVKSSHPEFDEIASYLQNESNDFEQHEGMFFQLSSKYDTLFGAFLHRTNRGQGQGGLRYWPYATIFDFLFDGLRLSKGMTHKNSLAGLWWGGGKGIMIYNPEFDKSDVEIRNFLYKEYGEFITSLNGAYITAEDVGTSESDMAQVFANTRFTSCIPKVFGGSGNPSSPTASGVRAGMEAAVEFIGEGTLEGKTVAVQGLGHVATPLINFLYEKGVDRVVACDIFPDVVESAKNEFKDFNFEARLVDKSDSSILEEECDILAPCATGAILNSESIPKIKAKIVCGASNNQLANPAIHDKELMDRGIVYVPDFLINRMGIVNCADEQAGYVNNDPIVERHLSKDWEHSIHKTTLEVLQNSKETGTPPGAVAVDLADKLSRDNHPVYGHRTQLIINSLVDNKWELG